MIQFTTWEEWNDMVEKIKAGLVVCPDCNQWTTGLIKIQEEYRNLNYRKHFVWWTTHPDVETGASKEEIFAYVETLKEKTEYCCEACLLCRAKEKETIDLEEKFDKCDVCGEWVELGSTVSHRRHGKEMTRLFCVKCLEIDQAETEFLERTAKERGRIFAHNKRTAALGLISDLTIHEWLEIIDQYGDSCAYCGDPWTDLEHVIPVSNGGGTTKSNVVPACRGCNTEKRSRNLQPRTPDQRIAA
jgi:hypothetical protein